MRPSAIIPLVAFFPTALGQLNTLAKARGLKYFGSATDNSELSDTQYTSILSNTAQFGQITPGNTQKWVYIEPSQNSFSYTQGDVITDFAEKNGQLLRCHNLCWYNELPSWVTSGSWTNATLIAVLQNHIKNEVTHYKGQCYAWDVVNEAFNDDGTYRTDVFYNVIGPEYIPIAFQAAAQYDSSVKLYYNDYNIEYSGAKATAVHTLVSSLKSRGIKIDGVGLQAHFIVGQTPNLASQVSNLNYFINLGVEVAYTELDIRFTSLPPSSSGLSQQSTDYVNTVMACVNTAPGCVGVTVWDYTDKYSWIPGTFSGQGDACLWYSDFTTHPAYTAVISALGGAATSTAVTSTAVTSTAATSTATTLSTKTQTTTSSSGSQTGGTIPVYGQCGGMTWTGSGTCASGSTCKYSNPYYSQCLP